ncbi:MAG: endonuclease [Pseudomonadota bacterium]
MNNQNGIGCALGCWLVAAGGGVLTAALLMVLGNWTFLQAAFMGAVVFVAAGALLSWIICKPLPAPGAGTADAAPGKAAPRIEATPAPAAAAAAPAATAAPAAEVKASTQLPGQDELAERKGEWSYDKSSAAEPEAAAAPAPEPEPSMAEAAAAVPAGEEKKPETLSAAREGGPDDLKMIKGVGPKLEGLLHSLGFYHFDQIANWQAAEVAWVDQNLQGFKGRVSRDNWVAQAKLLAAGGETEFSKKVEKGGVYE